MEWVFIVGYTMVIAFWLYNMYLYNEIRKTEYELDKYYESLTDLEKVCKDIVNKKLEEENFKKELIKQEKARR